MNIEFYNQWNKGDELTQEFVKFLFDYKDGNLYWKIFPNRNKKVKIGDKVGSPNSVNRLCVQIKTKGLLVHRVIFLYHHGYMPEFVDHLDRDISNNRIENLRAATKSQNNANSVSRKNSSSKYLGVELQKCTSKYTKKDGSISLYTHYHWRSTIIGEYIGLFKTEILAALAYNKAAVKYHGEFANLNIIKP